MEVLNMIIKINISHETTIYCFALEQKKTSKNLVTLS